MELKKGSVINILPMVFLLAGLQAAVGYRFSLFHAIIELLCVFCAYEIFWAAWNSREHFRDNHLLYIGIAFLFVGALDLLHFFTNQDMTFFSGGMNLSSKLWLVARYFQNTSILFGLILFTKKRVNPVRVFFWYFLAIVAVLYWIFGLKTFPDCLSPQTGTTYFKIINEYVIAAILALFMLILFFRRKNFEKPVLVNLLLSLFTAILSELAFAKIQHVESVYSSAGHYLKLFSYYLFYTALVKTVLIKPYDSLAKQEDALQNEKERLAITLRSIGDGVIATDIVGRINLLNRTGEKITGWKQSEVLGKTLDDVFYVIDDKTSEPYINIAERVLESKKTFTLESNAVLVTRDLFERQVSVSCSPMQNAKGAFTGVVLVFRDVTDKRRTEKGLINSLKLESLGIMAGGIAHDFNNILAGMLTNIQLAQILAEDGKNIQRYLNDIEQELNKAADLTKQLMTFSKGGAPVKQAASIFELVRETAEFTLRGSNILCEYGVADDLWAVEIDKCQISQVINNLVINAKQAMANGGILIIQGENVTLEQNEGKNLPAGKYVRISVVDQGIGIPEDNLDRIFDPYFTTKPEGNGLGLSTSYSIIRKHNGFIEVESELGVRSCFYLYLPATEQCGTNESENGDRPDGKGRYLFMDDSEAIL